MNDMDPANAGWFRQVMGQYPTGVCVVTAYSKAQGPQGMVVGSFTSASLAPPLVAFLPDKSSSSWPKIAETGSFCVNILGHDQEEVCRRFAAKGGDKFAGQTTRLSPGGSPILDGVVAWIDCTIDSVTETGDHYLVLGAVQTMQLEQPGLPLLFFRGGYGRFSPLSLTAPESGRLARQLRHVDVIRPVFERVARELHGRCIATAKSDDGLVVVASADSPDRDLSPGTLAGHAMPYVPPTASPFVAWEDTETIDAWIAKNDSSQHRTEHREALARIRRRGYSVGLLTEGHREFASQLRELALRSEVNTPFRIDDVADQLRFDPPELDAPSLKAVRLISVPVFGPTRKVELTLTAYEFAKPPRGINEYIKDMVAAGEEATRLLAASMPALDRPRDGD